MVLSLLSNPSFIPKFWFNLRVNPHLFSFILHSIPNLPFVQTPIFFCSIVLSLLSNLSFFWDPVIRGTKPGEPGNRTRGTGEWELGNGIRGTGEWDPGNRGMGPRKRDPGNGVQGSRNRGEGIWQRNQMNIVYWRITKLLKIKNKRNFMYLQN